MIYCVVDFIWKLKYNKIEFFFLKMVNYVYMFMIIRCVNKVVNILYYSMINEYEIENNNVILF